MQNSIVVIFAYGLYIFGKVRIRNIITLLLLSLLATACNTDKGDAEGVVPTPVELVIRASQGVTTRASVVEDPEIVVGADLATADLAADPVAPDTRTELGTATDSELPIHWSGPVKSDVPGEDKPGDQIMVWAKPNSSTTVGYAFEQTVFSLAHFNYTYSSADFTAVVANKMDKDYSYTYHAIYPIHTVDEDGDVIYPGPTGEITNTSVTYSLPATQTGDYNGAYDIMRGTATGAALNDSSDADNSIWPQPELRMQHLMHLMRIRVPENRNLMGRSIKRLEITFPQEIVGGTMTFDPTDPTKDPTWSGQSAKVTIDFDDTNLLDAAGRDVWIFVKPGEINGDISFQAYDTAGVPAAEISTTVDKTLQSQHITPIALTIPSLLYPVTYLKITETANNLGEAWNTMTLSNATFVKPFTLETTNSLGVTPNTTKVYEVAIAAEPSTMQGKSIAASYDSPNAIVSNSIALPSTISNKQANVNNQVPYLFFEDFSSVTGHSQNDADETADYTITGYDLSKYGFKQYWSGARTGSGAGQSVRINSRADVVKIDLGFLGSHGGETRTHGRLDSSPISSIKSGKRVNVSVSFNYDGDINGNSVFYPFAVCGYSTFNSNSYVNNSYLYGSSANILKYLGIADANTVDQWNISEPITIPDIQTDGSYGSITQSMSYTINNCTSSHRLSWEINAGGSTASITNGAQWLYLDNIKVSIAQ